MKCDPFHLSKLISRDFIKRFLCSNRGMTRAPGVGTRRAALRAAHSRDQTCQPQRKMKQNETAFLGGVLHDRNQYIEALHENRRVFRIFRVFLHDRNQYIEALHEKSRDNFHALARTAKKNDYQNLRTRAHRGRHRKKFTPSPHRPNLNFIFELF